MIAPSYGDLICRTYVCMNKFALPARRLLEKIHRSMFADSLYLQLNSTLTGICAEELPIYLVLATRLTNHAACNVESRSLNRLNSVSTAQLVELTSDVFEIILRKRVQRTLPAGRPGTVQARPRPSPT